MKFFKFLRVAVLAFSLLLAPACSSMQVMSESQVSKKLEQISKTDDMALLEKIMALREGREILFQNLVALAKMGVADEKLITAVADQLDSAEYFLSIAYVALLEGNVELSKSLTSLVEKNLSYTYDKLMEAVEVLNKKQVKEKGI